ncbi:MAG: hypothetical protein M3R00_06280, partial [Pseudomonadota bacterium]|nr:hypothetical protein [Pseudomonadota bacterium]
MSYFYQEWCLISTKIKSLIQTSAFLCGSLDLKAPHESEIMVKSVGSSAKEIFHIVEGYKIKYAASLSKISLDAFD